ncbi:MAG: prolyl oligopeptidase family serine peptidase [Candidatus Latescibacteria bacterium]|nr:prolyl oligopeptidase family serine peptidase [Candidatus Latescibacterota bacterium]
MNAYWDCEKLAEPPETFAAPGFSAPGVEALFFAGEPYQGKETRVFAWMGMPYVPKGQKCPAMVLLHGGGGTAFDEWVRIWNRRGYAAIAFDQCGCVPERPEPQGGQPHQRHEYGGPPGWDASFDQVDQEVSGQWQYHAVAAALRAHSLLASQPQVDADRIGVTGISWGGYLTCLVAAVDTRYQCAIPVYGCGFLGDNSVWKHEAFRGRSPESVARWLEAWDPSRYLQQAAMPFCWVSGTNDFAYPLDSLQKSYRLPPGPRTLCIGVEMPHSHADGWAPGEMGAFADSILDGGAPLARIVDFRRLDNRLVATFQSARPIVRAEICYTRASGYWSDRKYNVLPATIDYDKGRVEAVIPSQTRVCFLNLYDDRGCVVSTEHIEL